MTRAKQMQTKQVVVTETGGLALVRKDAGIAAPVVAPSRAPASEAATTRKPRWRRTRAPQFGHVTASEAAAAFGCDVEDVKIAADDADVGRHIAYPWEILKPAIERRLKGKR
jgi:hypothetical protein